MFMNNTQSKDNDESLKKDISIMKIQNKKSYDSSVKTLSVKTLSVKTLSVKTLSVKTLSVKTLSVKTQYYEQIFDKETADNAYIFLKDNINWEDGIYSRIKKKHSRIRFILAIA